MFFYDLGDPQCYLAAERIAAAFLPVVPEWEPVAGAELGLTADWNRESIERGVRELELQPLRWPEPWPMDTRLAALAGTYAKRIGRAVAFSLAAFRQAFAGGRQLDEDTVLIAGAACEIHPSALLKGIATRATAQALAAAGARARQAGVDALPALQVGKELFSGEGALAGAAAALAEAGDSLRR